jgi:hypothetical protein
MHQVYHPVLLSIYIIKPMHRASIPAIVATVTGGLRAIAPPVVEVCAPLLVWEDELPEELVEFAVTVLAPPPSTAMPGRFLAALAARAV